MQKTLNLKVKYRESFRPFAPSVIAEKVGDRFDIDRASPYMLLVADVVVGWELLNERYSSLLRMGYGVALLLLCLAGLASQLRLATRKSFRIGSWLLLAALIFEVVLFVFLKAYYGTAPVPHEYSDSRQFQFHPALVGTPRPTDVPTESPAVRPNDRQDFRAALAMVGLGRGHHRGRCSRGWRRCYSGGGGYSGAEAAIGAGH